MASGRNAWAEGMSAAGAQRELDVTEGLPHLADRLNDLFAKVPRPDGKAPYSNEAVAEALTRQGVSVTGVYISQMRTGRKANPSARLLHGLAKHFGVPVTYFFDDDEAESIRSQLDALANVRDARIEGIMTRTQGVSEANLANITAIIESIRKLEGLDSDATPPQEKRK